MIQFEKKGSMRNFRQNLFLLISACAFTFLPAGRPEDVKRAALVCLVFTVASFFLSVQNKQGRRRIRPVLAASVVIFLFIMAARFYLSWENNGSFGAVASRLGFSAGFLVLAAAVVLCFLSFYFLLFILDYLSEDSPAGSRISLLNSKAVRCALCLLALAGFVLALVYSFNGYIWADEAYSLRIIDYSYSEIVSFCAGDVHPPFYYLALKAVEQFGSLFFHGLYASVVIGKLFSLLPMVILAVILWQFFKRRKSVRPLAILCLFGMPQLLHYSVEIRMYSWALLFVTLTYLSALKIISGKAVSRDWCSLIVFSLLSAYTHNFALISMACIWLYLLIWILLYDRKLILRLLLSGMVVAVLFFPWLLVLLRQTGYVSEGYWILQLSFWNYIGFFDFAFKGLALWIPVLVTAGVSRDAKLTGRKWFEESIGWMIPLTLTGIGIAASLLIRPLFVDRYIFPALMCMWISFVLLMRRFPNRLKAVLVVVFALVSLRTYTDFRNDERSTTIYNQEIVELFDGMEDDAVVIVSNPPTLTDTVAVYRTGDVYEWQGADPNALQTTKYRVIFTNAHSFDDSAMITGWLEEGRPVYYVAETTLAAAGILPDTENWDFEPIGNYTIGTIPVQAFKIVREQE